MNVQTYSHDCGGLSHLELRDIPEGTKHVTFVNAENVTRIGDDFLRGCRSLTSVDLSPLKNVTRIGDYFMAYCPSLSSLDLSPLQNVTRIGGYFLWWCKSLTSIDLSPLKNVTRIGYAFLWGCENLTLTEEQKKWIKEKKK